MLLLVFSFLQMLLLYKNIAKYSVVRLEFLLLLMLFTCCSSLLRIDGVAANAPDVAAAAAADNAAHKGKQFLLFIFFALKQTVVLANILQCSYLLQYSAIFCFLRTWLFMPLYEIAFFLKMQQFPNTNTAYRIAFFHLQSSSMALSSVGNAIHGA